MAEFKESLLIKLLEERYIYNSIDSINIKKNKIDHIFQGFLQSQTLFKLLLFIFNLKIGAIIIFFCNLYLALRKCNGIYIIIT